MIKLGNTDIEKVYLGSNEINKAYLGNQVIFDNTAVNPFADATLAYSLRDLGLGATHVVRVRRDSDNVEQDFTAAEITDGTLDAFLSTNNGFNSTFYDQVGTNNAIKNTAANQPKYIDTTRPSFKYQTDDNLVANYNFDFIQNTLVFTLNVIFKIDDLNNRGVICANSTSSADKGFFLIQETNPNGRLIFSQLNGTSARNFVKVTDVAVNDNNYHLVSVVGDGNDFKFFIDGVKVNDTINRIFRFLSTGAGKPDFVIADSTKNVGAPFDGEIEHLSIFNRSLSLAEINEIKNQLL